MNSALHRVKNSSELAKIDATGSTVVSVVEHIKDQFQLLVASTAH